MSKNESDRPANQEVPVDSQSDRATEEAGKSAVEIVKQQRREMQLQKDPDRPPLSTSLKFGRPEIVGDEGVALVKGTASLMKNETSQEKGAVQVKDSNQTQFAGAKDTAKESSPPPLEEPGKVKERIPAHTTAGHPFDEVIYEDGTKRQLRPGGIIFEMRKDMTITARPDHSMTITRDGQSREVKPSHPERGVKSSWVSDDGVVRYEYKDGTSEALYESGKHREYGKDGVSKDYDTDGKYTGSHKQHSDGSATNSDEKGRVTGTDHAKVHRHFRYDEQGHLTQFTGQTGTWKRMTDTDGKSYWQNQDDPSKQLHGDWTVDSHGHMHYKPHDPHGQAWIFKRDGTALKVPPPDAGSAKKDPESREPATVDTSVSVPRDLFDKQADRLGDTSKPRPK